MRTFELHRVEDLSGISGTGIVAQGCHFDNGKVSMTWINPPHSMTWFDDIETVIHIHGHNGRTKLIFSDGEEIA
jgi:hypothetical protein